MRSSGLGLTGPNARWGWGVDPGPRGGTRAAAARRQHGLQPYVSGLGCSRMCGARRRGRQRAEAALGREQLQPRELVGGAVLRHVRPCLL